MVATTKIISWGWSEISTRQFSKDVSRQRLTTKHGISIRNSIWWSWPLTTHLRTDNDVTSQEENIPTMPATPSNSVRSENLTWKYAWFYSILYSFIHFWRGLSGASRWGFRVVGELSRGAEYSFYRNNFLSSSHRNRTIRCNYAKWVMRNFKESLWRTLCDTRWFFSGS